MSHTSAHRSAWVDITAPSRPGGLILLAFPYAGGGAAAFHGWQASLPEGVTLWPVHLPGRGKRFRDRPLTRLTQIVEAVGPELLPLLDRPFAALGHSMGGLISFELARWLRRHSTLAPEALFVSGSAAPDSRAEDPATYTLKDAEFVAYLRALNGTPEDLLNDEEALSLLLPAIRADFEAVQTYRYAPEPPLACPIHVYGGTHDPLASMSQNERWRAHTTGTCDIHSYPGGHFFIHEARTAFMKQLAADLHATCDSTGRRPHHG